MDKKNYKMLTLVEYIKTVETMKKVHKQAVCINLLY